MRCFKCCTDKINKKALERRNSRNTEWLAMKNIFTQCKVIDVYDGDTMTIIMDFGGTMYKKKCRLTGIDTAEIRTKDPEEKKFGLEAKQFVQDRLLNRVVWIICHGWDKFGRLLGTIYENKKDNVSINDLLITKGLAYAYDGKTPRKQFHEWRKKQR